MRQQTTSNRHGARAGARLRIGTVTAGLLGLLLVGCGSLPNGTISYYQAKSQVTVKVTRSILCDSKNNPLVASSATPSVAHSANFAKSYSTDLGGLNGTFTDSDIKFDFYEDGRLKGVNATQTGQGEAIVKAAVTLAATVGAFASDNKTLTYPKECAFIKDVGGGKPLTLNYELALDPANNGAQPISPDGASSAYADWLKEVIPDICAIVRRIEVPAAPMAYAASDAVVIKARQPALVTVEVGAVTPGLGCDASIWRGRVPVAQLGVEYPLPIPKPAAFGKQTLSVGFAESGAVSSIQYVSTSGAAGALNAANTIAGAMQDESTSAKAADVKAEADLIAQQQRLLQCRADPKSCK
jgi:hypothetical protein